MEKIRRKKRKEKSNKWLWKNNNVDVSNYKYKPRKKKEFNNIIAKSEYIRDSVVRELALQLANFQCEIDKEHTTFISKATLRNYVESHHLIPMKYYDDFEVSIDNEANIVALCPNCHRLLHHSRFEDKKILLEKLYYKHIESLKKAGIEITLERLLDMYKG
ncbi:5-methylcytosine-specific restriction endonuclease McrA [Clostridium beijerinckii]|uniref:HNH endonuclease n=1 Tax=Clostridium beijerinckii TaxID=1520 RepID=UPI00156F747F|nr:HNH endonuclease [Clostridium beijerinckii]NRT32619.1 5-methylcytosine-specific restriction endonuclease McrA [Clostridium beijerinckii]NRT47953.1 5-methylcytosine-specific restriction endonuclease McrA [Clostridium beijerinckii]NRZ23751.1 5-methylcytosine-specific restriction endonuclease McrA [Clostridium beijerinckii]